MPADRSPFQSRAALLLAGVLMALALPAVAQAQAPPPGGGTPNDAVAQATELTLDIVRPSLGDFPEINAGADSAPEEPLTPTGTGTCEGRQMDKTVWYRFIGDGLPVTVSTRGSQFDTVVAAFPDPGFGSLPSLASSTGCSNNIASDELTSEFSFNSLKNRKYLIQVGGCFQCPSGSGAFTTDEGGVKVVAYTRPVNDAEDKAQTLDADKRYQRDNRWATSVPGEQHTCVGDDGSTSEYSETVWFRFKPQYHGRATFDAIPNTTSFDPVVRVFRPDRTSVCNDDAADGVGPASLEMTVEPGTEYLVQVGGYAGGEGAFTYRVDFVRNLDVDGDGYSVPADCDDGAGSVNPGATEVPNNTVDENCDRIQGHDADRDGVWAEPLGRDCDDARPSVHPGAPEVAHNGLDDDCRDDGDDKDADNDGHAKQPIGDDCDDDNAAVNPGVPDIKGNARDENCDDLMPPAPMDPYPQFSFPNIAYRNGARFAVLEVSDVGRGYRVRVTCRSSGHGCPFKRNVRSATAHGSMRFRQFRNRMMRPGSRVTVSVTIPGSNRTGRFGSWTVRRGKQVKRVTGCLRAPQFRRHIRC